MVEDRHCDEHPVDVAALEVIFVSVLAREPEPASTDDVGDSQDNNRHIDVLFSGWFITFSAPSGHQVVNVEEIAGAKNEAKAEYIPSVVIADRGNRSDVVVLSDHVDNGLDDDSWLRDVGVHIHSRMVDDGVGEVMNNVNRRLHDRFRLALRVHHYQRLHCVSSSRGRCDCNVRRNLNDAMTPSVVDNDVGLNNWRFLACGLNMDGGVDNDRLHFLSRDVDNRVFNSSGQVGHVYYRMNFGNRNHL